MPALPFKASAQQIFASAAADRPEPETSETVALTALISRFVDVRVRFQIIGHARIKNVGKYQSCMVSKLPVIWKQTVCAMSPCLTRTFVLVYKLLAPALKWICFDSAAYLLTSCLGPCMYVRARVQFIRHSKPWSTDIPLHNECAHVGLSDLYTTRSVGPY